MTVGLLSTGKPLIVCVSCELGPRDTQGGSAGSDYRLRSPQVPTGCHQVMHSFSELRHHSGFPVGPSSSASVHPSNPAQAPWKTISLTHNPTT